jgi:hypothetical protein
MAAAFGFGTSLLRFLPNTFSRSTRILCALISGFGLLGLTLFVVGYLSFTKWTVGAVLFFGLALAARKWLRSNWEFYLPLSILPAAIVCVVLSVTAIAGLGEPTGDWNIDGVAYHLVGPKVWTHNEIIRPIPENMNTSYPSTVETVFAALFLVGGDRAPGFSACWTLALLLAITASLGVRCGVDFRNAWWIAALLVAMGAVYAGSVGTFIDGIYAAFVLAALRTGLDATKRAHFLAFGMFCGLAMATKYPAIVALLPLIVCVVWDRERIASYREMVIAASIAAVTACVVASPIYLKNWYFLGSPIYPPPPSLLKYFPVKYFPAVAIRAFYDYNIHRGAGHGRALWHFFTLPFNLTFHTADFSGAGGIGIAPLAFGSFGVYAAWGNRFARRVAIAGVMLAFVWFATMQESRYLYHAYAISAVFAVIGWHFLASIVGGRARTICATAVAISLAYGLILILPPQLNALPAVLFERQARERHARGIPWVESFDYINDEPAVKRVLILDRSVLTYYSDKDYLKPFGQWGEQVYSDVSKPAEALARLSSLQVSHVLDVKSTVSDFCVPTDYPGLQLVFERPGQRIYAVVTRN